MANPKTTHAFLTQKAERIIKQVFGRAAERSLSLNIEMLPELVLWTVLRGPQTVAREAIRTTGIDCRHFEQHLNDFIEKRHKRSRGDKFIQTYDVGA